jgi:hypothetical protein
MTMGDLTQQPQPLHFGYRDLEYPEWKREYVAAIMETDPLKLQHKIHLAQDALLRRSQSPERHDPERQAMKNATDALRFLLVEVLGHPDSRK